ncbi:piggyBac transposable element-derived protein 4-like [Bactrocera dorsalis]|uniref:PiggyBac transposable element-derived protein 4-like n=1 Tax=Bactrocera dorsalis TaxID=27457 RepID=A0ABM3JM19_BACDO|nr:piggyBac transposable element-derived protein 4-like [Bactrocera dorsalis]
MSVKRVKFLLNSLRFDDATTRQARRTLDKAAPIREVLDMFTKNYLLPYLVGENVVIDEIMIGFRGKCPFRQYMKSKPDKYGIKLYPLVDAATFYVLNIELYAGKQPEGPYQVSNAASDVVKRLITPISGTGRNLTVDNWYTSVPLTNDLAKDHKISVVGTIRKNKKDIPPCFIDKKQPEYSSQFGFSDTATLVSYVPKKKRSVVLISSLHCAAEIDESTNEKRKPSIVTFYNKTKGGVDEVDKKA